MAMLLFSVILSTNVLIVWGILTQYNIVAYPSDVQYYIVEGSLIALLSSRFFIKNRYKKIVAKYDDENPMQRNMGTHNIYSDNLDRLFHRSIIPTRKNINIPLTTQDNGQAVPC